MVSVLDGYVPRAADPAAWQAVEPVVRDLLDGLPAPVAAKARFPLASLALWLHDQGHVPTGRLLLDEDQQAPWLAALASPRSAGTYRSALRAVADHHDPARAARRQPLTAADTGPAPYTTAEVAAMLAHAAALRTGNARISATALVLAGVGAGLDGRDLSGLTGAHVHRNHDGLVLVRVAGSRRPRTVAVLTVYADRLLTVAAASEGLKTGRDLVGRATTSRSVSEYAVSQFDGWGGPAVSARRLRITWMATHLHAGTPLPVLLAQAGTDTLRAVEHLAARLADDLEPDQLLAVAARPVP